MEDNKIIISGLDTEALMQQIADHFRTPKHMLFGTEAHKAVLDPVNDLFKPDKKSLEVFKELGD